MKIFVKAKPNSKEEKVYPIKFSEADPPPAGFNRVEKLDGYYVVCVKEPPEKGKANNAIKNALAVYFMVGSSSVKIISGYSSRNKIIEIL